jgi:hypothetical protein
VTARKGFWLLAAALLPLFLAASRDFGATWDEFQQHGKAQRMIDYWAGRRAALDEPIDGAHLYGAPVDVIALPLASRLGVDPYVAGHAVNAVVGWLGLVLAGALAARLFGYRQGALTMALLAATPQYVAHAMNNPKDLPFATMATASLLAMTWVTRTPPFIGLRTGALLALVLGLGLNVRAGALLFVGYLAVLVGYYASEAGRFNFRTLAPAVVRIALVVAGALAIGWVAWPWAYGHPLTAPLRAMRELSHFPWGGNVLFGGSDLPSEALPWTYVPVWMWLSLPPVVLAGVPMALLGLTWRSQQERLVALLACIIFPIVYVVGTQATLYSGIRHLLFILPPLAVLASAGWVRAIEATSGGARLLLAAALVAGVVEPLGFQWRNHPNQIAYVQPLAGGPAAHFGRYDLDYWGNCMLQSMERLARQHPQQRVRITGWPLVVLQMNARRFPTLDVVDGAATYSIELLFGRREHVLELESMPDVIDRVTTADGAVLCVTRAAATPLPQAVFDRRK